MGKKIVQVFNEYVASQCQIYEMYELTTYFVILGLMNICSKGLSDLDILG